MSNIKATIRQSRLKQLLDRASGAVGRMHPYFLLEIYLTRMTCSATDTHVGIVAETNINKDLFVVEYGGIACVPAKKLQALVDALPDTMIDLEGLQNGHLQVSCGDYVGVIPCLDPLQYFPKMDLPKGKVDIWLAGDVLPGIISACNHSRSDGKNHLLEGLHICIENGNLVGVATNGTASLSLAGKGDLEEGLELFGKGLTLPSAALNEIKKINAGNCELWLTEGALVIAAPGITILARLLDGEYVNYRRVIPTDYTSSCVVNAQELARIADRVNILSESDHVVLDIQGGTDGGDIRISAENSAGESYDLVPAEIQGGNLSILVKPAYLTQSLRALAKDSVDVLIKYGTSEQALIILPCDHSGWNERLEIVMPRKR